VWRFRRCDDLALAEAAAPVLTGPEQGAWIRRLAVEHDNLRAALEWCRTAAEPAVEAGGLRGPEIALRLGAALWKFWFAQVHLTEGRNWLEWALAARGAGEVPDAVIAQALLGAGALAFYQGDFECATIRAAASLTLFREGGDHLGIAFAGNVLGSVAAVRGECEQAEASFKESLALSREIGDRFGVALSLRGLGFVASRRGDYTEAGPLLEESLSLFRALEDLWGIALTLEDLGEVALCLAEYERARALFEEVLERSRQLGSAHRAAGALSDLGIVARATGEYDRAASLLRQALVLQREIAGRQGVVECLEELAAVLMLQLRADVAARLLSAAAALRDAIGSPLPPESLLSSEHQLDSPRAALGTAGFEAAWNTGRAMSWEQAVAYALGEGD
jgi:non-specific serine/threonine protein kinase